MGGRSDWTRVDEKDGIILAADNAGNLRKRRVSDDIFEIE